MIRSFFNEVQQRWRKGGALDGFKGLDFAPLRHLRHPLIGGAGGGGANGPPRSQADWPRDVPGKPRKHRQDKCEGRFDAGRKCHVRGGLSGVGREREGLDLSAGWSPATMWRACQAVPDPRACWSATIPLIHKQGVTLAYRLTYDFKSTVIAAIGACDVQIGKRMGSECDRRESYTRGSLFCSRARSRTKGRHGHEIRARRPRTTRGVNLAAIRSVVSQPRKNQLPVLPKTPLILSSAQIFSKVERSRNV